ncbi:MAG: hypothetical protein SW833_13015 [Cyanobacteriota bacterium]|nr:hypothetical protein [Cyanobacteriota bacterium]
MRDGSCDRDRSDTELNDGRAGETRGRGTIHSILGKISSLK